jgi:hypothetical protein
MNHSLIGADRTTHLKIVVIALIAGIVVVLVGTAARLGDFETASALLHNGPVVKAGEPTAISDRGWPTIR